MDVADAYRSPPIKPEPRWGREDTMDRNPMNEVYRRRSPGKQLSQGVIAFTHLHFELLTPKFVRSDWHMSISQKELIFTVLATV